MLWENQQTVNTVENIAFMFKLDSFIKHFLQNSFRCIIIFSMKNGE